MKTHTRVMLGLFAAIAVAGIVEALVGVPGPRGASHARLEKAGPVPATWVAGLR